MRNDLPLPNELDLADQLRTIAEDLRPGFTKAIFLELASLPALSGVKLLRLEQPTVNPARPASAACAAQHLAAPLSMGLAKALADVRLVAELTDLAEAREAYLTASKPAE